MIELNLVNMTDWPGYTISLDSTIRKTMKHKIGYTLDKELKKSLEFSIVICLHNTLRTKFKIEKM